MRKLFLICFLILQSFSFTLHAEEQKPSFALYLVRESSKDIKKAILESRPLITDQDIQVYDWKHHTISLTENGSKKIPKEPGAEFIIVVNGQRCYQGAFWSSVLSASYGKPIIDVLKNNHVIKIERSYPTDKFAEGTDPRADERVKYALRLLGKLKITEQNNAPDQLQPAASAVR